MFLGFNPKRIEKRKLSSLIFLVLAVISICASAFPENESAFAENLRDKIDKARSISTVDTEKVSDILRTSSEPSIIETDLVNLADIPALEKSLEETPDSLKRAMIRASLFQLKNLHQSARSVIKTYMANNSARADFDSQIDDSLTCVQTDAVQEVFPKAIIYAYRSSQENPLASQSESRLYMVKNDGTCVAICNRVDLENQLISIGQFPSSKKRQSVVVAAAELSEHLGLASHLPFNAIDMEQVKKEDRNFKINVEVRHTADTTGSIEVSLTFDNQDKISQLRIQPKIGRGLWSNLALPFPVFGLRVPFIVLLVASSLFITWICVLARFGYHIVTLRLQLNSVIGSLPSHERITLKEHKNIEQLLSEPPPTSRNPVLKLFVRFLPSL